MRRRPILLLEEHLISESSHERTDRGWRFGQLAPPLKGVTEEGADYEEGKEEVVPDLKHVMPYVRKKILKVRGERVAFDSRSAVSSEGFGPVRIFRCGLV